MTWSPRSAIDVRLIGVDDWPLWRDLRLEALREAPHAFRSTLAEGQGEGDTEMRWRARLSTVRINVVAYLNGKAAGIVSGTAANRDGTIELISMWVAPLARGQGVADSLVATVIELARGQRSAKIALAVVESNEYAVSPIAGSVLSTQALLTAPAPASPLSVKWSLTYRRSAAVIH